MTVLPSGEAGSERGIERNSSLSKPQATSALFGTVMVLVSAIVNRVCIDGV